MAMTKAARAYANLVADAAAENVPPCIANSVLPPNLFTTSERHLL